ncbi:MAG TPA: plasmid mobilization relaxosome protein MobC [Clostridia bacterium]|nr:plasmid mobilization relaxosome protein MobC [Clostridia bacterium]
MAKREHRRWTRLDDEEDDLFGKNFKKSALKSPSEYVRQAILYPQIKPPPPPELVEVLKAILRENQAQGNNLNQIAFNLNASGYPIPDEFREMQKEQKNLNAEIRAALCMLTRYAR